ncbi:MAG: YeiH family protein [Dehalobacterium sp.]
MIIKNIIPGMLFTSILAYISLLIPSISFLSQLHINSLIIAIIFGMIIKNCFTIPSFLEPGINYAFKKILRFAIILLGFKLSLGDVGQIGGKGILLVIVVTGATLFFTNWLGKRMGMDPRLAVLIGAGSSICGASAIAAVAPVINAEDQDITFAVATVTIFGTLAMFLYPVFYHVFQLPNLVYAVWAGSSIHEVAQVVAAGFAAGEKAGEYATLIKLTRVLLVIPTVLFLGFTAPIKEGGSRFFHKGTFPWFVFGFCMVVLVNSFSWISQETVASLISIDNFLLTVAMVALGLGSDFNKMKAAGLKPLYAGLCITLFISILSFALSGLLYV